MKNENTIIKKLGNQQKRRFGSIYLMKNNVNNQLLVVKSVSKNDKNQIGLERLRAESTFSFSNKGLPSVHDFIETNDSFELTTSFIEGIQLDEYWKTLRRKEQLPFLVDLFEQLDNLLAIIHSQQIIHCDLKPSNILINDMDGIIEVAIIDFGLAIKTNEQNNRKLIFPLGYAAPELILNELNSVNNTTDYFSLGIVIWRLFNDKLPFSHPNPSIYTNLQLTYPLGDTDSMPKNLIKIISRLCVKPIFRIPPNKMSEAEIQELITTCQKSRYQNLRDVILDLQDIKTRKRFLFF